MDVGILVAPRVHRFNPKPLPDLYAEAIEEAVLAEALGFSHIWVAEHHFQVDAWNPSPLLLLTAVAARTQRIRLGTYIMLLALQTNPLRLAEDIATLDIISNGRFDLGIAAGNFQDELDQFGVSRDEIYGRAFEMLEVIDKAFTEEVFSHHGKYFHYDNVHNTTKPVQKPFPIYSAMAGPKNLVRSVKRGYGTVQGLSGDLWERYSAAWVEDGRDLKDTRVISAPMFAHVADSREQAWKEAGPNVHAWFETYPEHMRRHLPPLEEMDKPRDFLGYGNPVAFGTAKDVLELFSRYKGQRCDEIAITFHTTGMDPKVVRRSMETFAREVMPEIKSWPTGV